jgi:hypothetical protein
MSVSGDDPEPAETSLHASANHSFDEWHVEDGDQRLEIAPPGQAGSFARRDDHGIANIVILVIHSISAMVRLHRNLPVLYSPGEGSLARPVVPIFQYVQ